MIDDHKVEEVNRKLDVVIRILAYQLVAGKTLSDGAPILRRLGLLANEIAAVFDTSANTVRVRLAESRRAKKKKQSA